MLFATAIWGAAAAAFYLLACVLLRVAHWAWKKRYWEWVVVAFFGLEKEMERREKKKKKEEKKKKE